MENDSRSQPQGQVVCRINCKGEEAAGNHTGENTGDSGQQTAYIESNRKGSGTLINTGFRALQMQRQ
jgi:hypothetical protein